MATKIQNTQAKIMDRLFDDFYYAAKGTLDALEDRYAINGVCAQIFGDDADDSTAKEHLRKSYAWATLQAIYDYAVHGIRPSAEHDGESSLVINASNVLKLASSEDYWPSKEWDNIIWMGDGRFGLDEGSPILLEKLALLANVDVRTVRNAISSVELVSFKKDSDGGIYIENASARRWLLGKKGFKPTVLQNDIAHNKLANVQTPADFGLFIAAQKKRIGIDQVDKKLVPRYPCARPDTLAELESGVFNLPLDAVFPVADFYQLHRKEFLACVMRVFFPDELHMLSAGEGGE